jgi:hypothetical protein
MIVVVVGPKLPRRDGDGFLHLRIILGSHQKKEREGSKNKKGEDLFVEKLKED